MCTGHDNPNWKVQGSIHVELVEDRPSQTSKLKWLSCYFPFFPLVLPLTSYLLAPPAVGPRLPDHRKADPCQVEVPEWGVVRQLSTVGVWVVRR